MGRRRIVQPELARTTADHSASATVSGVVGIESIPSVLQPAGGVSPDDPPSSTTSSWILNSKDASFDSSRTMSTGQQVTENIAAAGGYPVHCGAAAAAADTVLFASLMRADGLTTELMASSATSRTMNFSLFPRVTVHFESRAGQVKPPAAPLLPVR